MSSVRQVAEHANVSIATVSRVLNNHAGVTRATREAVLDAANTLNYVARVGRKSTSNIALLYTDEVTIGSPFDAALLQGMSFGMESFGFDLLVLNARNARQNDESMIQMFTRKGVRGVVIRTTDRTFPACVEVAREAFPAVVVGCHGEEPLNFVFSDSRPASVEAVEHLIGLGHRRIGISLNIVDDADHRDRLQGWRDAHEKHGLTPDETLILRAPGRSDGGEQLIRRIVSGGNPPTALFITDPYVAVGAIGEAHRMGIDVPGDLSIVGFDDSELRRWVWPQMSAVCQDAVELGREAFSRLNRILDARDGASIQRVQVPLGCWFENNASSGPV